MKTLATYLFIVMTLLPFSALSQDTVNTAQLACAALKTQNLEYADSLADKALSEKITPARLALKADILYEMRQYAEAARYYTAADKAMAGTSKLKTAKSYTLAAMYDSAFASLTAYCNIQDRVSSAKIAADPDFEPLKSDSRWQNVLNQRDINPYQKDLESAEHLINTHRNGDAFVILNQVIKKHPSAHRAWYLRASAYYNDGNFKSALSDMEHAVKLRSRNSLYLNTMAEILFAQNKYSKAVETWIMAIKADEMAVDGFLGAAKSLLKSKDYQGAEKYSRLYLLMFQNNVEAVSVLSESLACQGDCVSALRVLNTMPAKNAAFYRSRGIIYLQSETYQFAIDDFNRAIDLDRTLFDIYLHRGLAYYMLGKKDDAKRDWNTAVKNRVYKANDYLEKYR